MTWPAGWSKLFISTPIYTFEGNLERYENIIFCWKRWILLYFFSWETPCHFWRHERSQLATALRISFFGKIICSKKKRQVFFSLERLSSRLFNQIQFLCKDAEVALFTPNIIFPVMAAGRNNLLPWLCSGSGSGEGTELTFFVDLINFLSGIN